LKNPLEETITNSRPDLDVPVTAGRPADRARANRGIVLQGLGRTSRIFLELHNGRPTANEFFRDSVSSLSLGLKIDL